jgi:putative metallohydrolase (TIGR04338 family)
VPPLSAAQSQVDHMRSSVYQAEDQFSAVCNRGGLVDFFGSSIDVPIQRRFGDIDSVKRYVKFVIGLMEDSYPQLTIPRVRIRKGSTRAHYEFSTKTIAIPVSDQWALRETVVLHEIAHHVAWFKFGGSVKPHGGEFTACMLELVDRTLGEGAALLLRAGYQELGVPVTTTGCES